MDKLAGCILVVDDDPDVLTAARIILRQFVTHVETENNPQKLNFLIRNKKYNVVLLDMNFSAGKTSGHEGLRWLQTIREVNPDQPVVMITAYGDINIAVEAMKKGAVDFVVKPWDNQKLEDTIRAVWKGKQQNKVDHQSKLTTKVPLIATSPVMKKILDDIEKIAATDANVLLLGENGTGKELIARYIHSRSHRSANEFVMVDVGALPANLFESELFGHRKGAFTDAKEDRVGRIETANNGTLFLDEIGNLSINLQPKLLTAIQQREVTPLGAKTTIRVDVRLICATNTNIVEAVSQGNFRQDLLYRINTIQITLPPLRERKEDIPELATFFINTYSTRYNRERELTEEALQLLMKHHWPGNIRELQHAIERAVIMSDDTAIRPKDFVLETKPVGEQKESLSIEAMEKRAIIDAIARYGGNMSKVASELRLGRTTLYRKILKYGINR